MLFKYLKFLIKTYNFENTISKIVFEKVTRLREKLVSSIQFWLGVVNRIDGLCSCQAGVQSYKKYADTNPNRDTNWLKKLNPNPTRPDSCRH